MIMKQLVVFSVMLILVGCGSSYTYRSGKIRKFKVEKVAAREVRLDHHKEESMKPRGIRSRYISKATVVTDELMPLFVAKSENQGDVFESKGGYPGSGTPQDVVAEETVERRQSESKEKVFSQLKKQKAEGIQSATMITKERLASRSFDRGKARNWVLSAIILAVLVFGFIYAPIVTLTILATIVLAILLAFLILVLIIGELFDMFLVSI
jgi:hypothetical protein